MLQPNDLLLPSGYTSRPAQIDTDLDAVVDLFNACTQADVGISVATPGQMRIDWGTPGLDLAKDSRVILTADGTLVGYLDVWMITRPPAHPFVWGCVHPDHRGRGIGTALISWGEQHARRVLEVVPSGLRVSLRSFAYHSETATRHLLDANGWRHIRSSYRMLIEMESPPPPPLWPQGIALRLYDPAGDAEAVYRADDETFRDHFGHMEQPFEEGFKRFMHHMTGDNYDPSLWFLAVDGDEIAGFSLCRPSANDDKTAGFISSLGVRRPWRKRGLGLALLQHSFGEFHRRGKRRVSLGVDAENLTGALRLYEKAGMRVQRQMDIYEKEIRPGEEISVQSLGT